MPRPKGSKLYQEQKDKIRLGKILEKQKIITESKRIKEPVYGWIIDGKRITPVFNAEKDLYKCKIYKDINKAAKIRDKGKAQNDQKICHKTIQSISSYD